MERLIIIGTSHIARQSKREVKKAIEANDPDIIAVELDYGRLKALLNPEAQKMRLSDIAKVGLKGWLFAVMGRWVENALGKHVGVRPGGDMLTAVVLAKSRKKQLALIDQDIRITLRKFSKAITWKEKWNFFVDIIKGVFSGRSKLPFDLTKVPEKKIIKKLIRQLKKRYPNAYEVLVADRNRIMARNLAFLLRNNPEKRIVAVVGAGHEEDILGLVAKHLKQ